MITSNNKDIKSIISLNNNKEIIRVTDTTSGEIVWEKTVTPAEIDYFYVQNTDTLAGILTVKQTITGTPDSNTYAKNIQYSKDKINWTTITLSSDGYRIPISGKVYFRGDEGVLNYWYSGGTNRAITTLNCSYKHIIGGNINTLLDYNNPNSLTLPQGAFNSIFENDTNLTSASEITLTPSVDGSLSTFAYLYMFRGCTGLITGPKSIPATKQGNGSCNGMFYGCSSLTVAPALPATTLSVNCFNSMFRGCSSLTEAPALLATTLNTSCFRDMYYGCVKLTKAPALLATTLAPYSYYQMFYGCSKLNEVTTYANDISAVDCTKNWLYGVASTGTFYNNGSANFTINSASGIPLGWTNVVPEVVEPDYFYIENLYDGSNTLTLRAGQSGNPSSDLYSNTVEYSKDKTNWTTITLSTSGDKYISMNQGEKVYFRNDNGKWNYYFDDGGSLIYYYNSFGAYYDCGSGGDVRSLLNYKNIENVVLTQGCFYSLFDGFSKLKTAPKLPATTLSPYCYNGMFNSCTSLTTAPALPATTLADYCYHFMFSGCTQLTEAPELPATTLSPYCYSYMFQSCTSLEITPAIKATTLADHCCYNMFRDCTSLTTAPALPATTLADYCYYYMFSGCTQLTEAPELPATTLASGCYSNMFRNCTQLTTAPALPATTLLPQCYQQMFYTCSSLNSITTYADDISANYCLYDWVSGVSYIGTFNNLGTATYPSGYSGIPSGWTVVTQ